MLRLLYTLLLTLVAPFFLYGLYKKKAGKPSVGSRWKEHFGDTPKLKSAELTLTEKKPIWLHAVSVGEVIAAAPIIKAFKSKYPEQVILVTTTTSTGAEQVAKMGDLVEHRYMPLDFGFAIKGFLKAVKPSQLLIMETELWPNTLHHVAKAGIPITVMNARLSQRSYLRYSKVQSIFSMLSKHISQVLCQHKEDAERFILLGISKEQVQVTGSIKFDIHVPLTTVESGKKLRSQLGKQRPVWIAASTHKGEDEQILAAHSFILKSVPDALLILVPRHPERFITVENLCVSEGFNLVSRTSGKPMGNAHVYLGDTMGEMMTLIGAADVCFMGGSLIGDKVGGHNLLEPAALAKPTLTGPSYFNFTDITKQLTQANATIVIQDDQQLATEMTRLFDDRQSISIMGQNAATVVESNKGAIEKTLSLIHV